MRAIFSDCISQSAYSKWVRWRFKSAATPAESQSPTSYCAVRIVALVDTCPYDPLELKNATFHRTVLRNKIICKTRKIGCGDVGRTFDFARSIILSPKEVRMSMSKAKGMLIVFFDANVWITTNLFMREYRHG